MGWVSLLVFVALGTLLEMLHAFKAPWYLGVTSETRRLCWTLAHVHGAALGLLNLALAAVCPLLPRRLHPAASTSLLLGTLLVPIGFFLGGLFVHGGDPGLGAVLIPPGALLVLVSLALVTHASLPPDPRAEDREDRSR